MEERTNLIINEQAADALRESAKWTMFLSIMGFIGIGFIIIAGVFMSTVMSALPESAMLDEGMGPFSAARKYIAIVYIVIGALYFFPVYYLYKYSRGTKESLMFGNSEMLSEALVYLKSHHKFLGISTIVVLSLYFLMFIGVIIFAASMASVM